MKNLFAAFAAGLLAMLLGCSPTDAESDERGKRVADADNSERNVRDRNDETLTPLDQGTSESDRNITQEVRKAVVANDALSTNAQNVKIITRDGVVTLRGPVKSEDEKTMIAKIAEKAVGAKSVDNQLEIESNK